MTKKCIWGNSAPNGISSGDRPPARADILVAPRSRTASAARQHIKKTIRGYVSSRYGPHSPRKTDTMYLFKNQIIVLIVSANLRYIFKLIFTFPSNCYEFLRSFTFFAQVRTHLTEPSQKCARLSRRQLNRTLEFFGNVPAPLTPGWPYSSSRGRAAP